MYEAQKQDSSHCDQSVFFFSGMRGIILCKGNGAVENVNDNVDNPYFDVSTKSMASYSRRDSSVIQIRHRYRHTLGGGAPNVISRGQLHQ